MNPIVLTDQQIELVTKAHDPVPICDEQGTVRGYITLLITEQELIDARRTLASTKRRYTTAEVLASLEARGAS